MSLFSLEAPFLDIYTVYWLPDAAQGIPKETVDNKWIATKKGGGWREYDTKKEAVKDAKKAAKNNKPSEVHIHKKGGDHQTEHKYHGQHIYGDSVR